MKREVAPQTKNMYGQDVRRGLDPTLEQLQQLDFEQCRDALLHLWRPLNAELVVVGDVDFAEVEQLSLKYLGELHRTMHQSIDLSIYVSIRLSVDLQSVQ